MGADSSKESQREREHIQAKQEMERQKRMYLEKCNSLQSALEKQKTAYLELKKKEEIEKEVERRIKKKEKEEEIKNLSRQQIPFNPSAPRAESPIPHQQPQPPTYQSQKLQHDPSNFQISNHQTSPNPFIPQTAFHGPMYQASSSREAIPATSSSHCLIPQGPLNFKPLIPEVGLINPQPQPSSFSSQTSVPQSSGFSTHRSVPQTLFSQEPPQTSVSQDTSKTYVPQVGPQRFVPQKTSQRSVLKETPQRYVPQDTPHRSVPQDTCQKSVPQSGLFRYQNQRLPNQSPTLSPSDTISLRSQNLFNKTNVPTPMSTNPEARIPSITAQRNSRDLSRENVARSPYSGVKNEIKNLDNARLYPNLDKKSFSGPKNSALILINDEENGNFSNFSRSCEGNSHVNDNNQMKRAEFRNKNKKGQAGRSDSKPRRNPKEEDDSRRCRTCKKIFGLRIYQCTEGHSSCHECKESDFFCGECSSPIDKRNFPLEDYLSGFERPCPNASEGCNRAYKAAGMEDHLKQCPFNDVYCPLSDIFGTCSWKGKFSHIKQHFDDNHPENQKEVDTEVIISDIYTEKYKLQLAGMGPYTFLVHTKVACEQIYMAIQHLGAQSVASNWVYEFHIYNKSEPRQKYVYSDCCTSVKTDIKKLFDEYKCACIPISYAKNFVNSQGYFTYKFFIKKENVKRGFNKKNFAKPIVSNKGKCNEKNDFEFL